MIIDQPGKFDMSSALSNFMQTEDWRLYWLLTV